MLGGPPRPGMPRALELCPPADQVPTHWGWGGWGGCLKAATWASRGLLDVCGRAHPGQGSGFGRLAWITRPACLPQVKGSRQPGSLGLQATAPLRPPPPLPLATRPRAHRVGGMSVPGEKPDLRRGRASLWPPPDCCRWPLAHCGHWGSDSARLRAGVPPPHPPSPSSLRPSGKESRLARAAWPRRRRAGVAKARRGEGPRQQRPAFEGGHWIKQGLGCQSCKRRGRRWTGVPGEGCVWTGRRPRGHGRA